MGAFIVITIMAVLVIGAFAYIPFRYIITAILNVVELPPDMSGAAFYAFITQLNYWYLLVVVLIPLLIWVIVNTQRPKGPYYR